METTATVFGISADNARSVGKVLAWAWLFGSYLMVDNYTFIILIANTLHFHRELLEVLGEAIEHEFTITEINWLGMVAYEYFLLMGLIGLFVLFDTGNPVVFLFLFAPWLCL